MAKQVGPHYVTGTIGELTFYKLFEQYYVRTKSSLNRDRIKRDKAFERFRRCASVFGRASALASVLYWSLPREQRGHGVQGRLTGEFYLLLLPEVSADEAVEVMVERWLGEKEKMQGKSHAEPQSTQSISFPQSRQGAKERKEGYARRMGGVAVVKGIRGKPKVFRVLERCRDQGQRKREMVGWSSTGQATGRGQTRSMLLLT